MGKAHIQGSKTEFPPQFAAVDDVARDRVGPSQQFRGLRHIACGQRLAHRRARDPQAMDLVAVHPCDIKTLRRTGGIQHGVIARTLGAKAEVVPDQHIAHAQSLHQNGANEAVWRLCGQSAVEGEDDGLVDTALGQALELVPQRAHAGGSVAGLLQAFCKIVAGMRLKGQHAARDAAALRFGAQQRQHGLVSGVNAIEIANGQRAGRGDGGVLETAEYLHGGTSVPSRKQGILSPTGHRRLSAAGSPGYPRNVNRLPEALCESIEVVGPGAAAVLDFDGASCRPLRIGRGALGVRR